MNFQIVGPLFDKVDGLTQTFVTDISMRAITTITPIVTVGLTLGLIAYGMLIIRGAVDMPVADFLGRVIRILIITSIAAAGGIYQTQIAHAIMAIPDEFAQALSSDATAGAAAANIIDRAASEGANYVADAFHKSGFFSGEGLAYGVIAGLSALSLGAVVGIGAAFVVIAKVALAILAGIGPIFIFALLWQPTARFFEMWVAQILNYALTIVLFSIVFSLLMDIYGGYMADAALDGAQNVAYTLCGMLVIGVVSIVLLLQLPSIASGLAGGVGISYWHELRALKSMGSSAAGGVRGAGRAVSGSARGAGKAAASTARGARRAYDYFKGRNR